MTPTLLAAFLAPVLGHGQWELVLPDQFVWGFDAKGDTLVVGTYDGQLFFSGDAGTTWSERTGNMPDGMIENIIIEDDERLICSNGNSVWTSTDWNTWTLRRTLTSTITCLVVQGDTVLAGGDLNAGLSASYNGGMSWATISTGQNQQYSTTVAISGDSILWGRFGAEAVVSVNGGFTWTSIAGLGNNIFSFSENGQFAGNDNYIFRRSGSGWSETFVDAQILDLEVDEDRVAACGACDGEIQYVFLSLDGGISWNAIEAPFAQGQINKVALVDQYLYAGANGLHRLDLDVWTGIEQRNIDREILLAPNPARQQVAVQLGNGRPMSGMIRILDASGRTVLSTKSTNMDRTMLDISALSPGTYQVVVEHTAGASSRPLIVVP
jgi:hypothetical protein